MNFFLSSICTIYLYIFPLIVSGILHMIIVRFDLLSFLKIPVHRRWFGENKTLRGFVVMPVLTMLGVFLAQLQEQWLECSLVFSQHSVFVLGWWLGLFYVLFELPNSWIKRKCGIQPGKMSDKNPWLFSLIDQADSAIGCVLVYMYFCSISIGFGVLIVLCGTGIHLVINLLLYFLGLRKNPI